MKTSILTLACFMVFAGSVMAQNFQWNKNPVIAHRGAWKASKIPQNSIASLKEAIRLKCHGAEFDVHQTKDGVLVVNHDNDYQGMVISNTMYQALKNHRLPNGERIPTLESYLKAGKKQRNTKLILEIKPARTPEQMMKVTDAVVAMVKRLNAEPWVEYISFDYSCLKRIVELDPSAKTAYLRGDVSAEKMKSDGLTGVDYNLAVYKKEDWFTKTKNLGLTLNAWTVNGAEDMKWLLDNNADYITTDEPELLLDIISKR
jgi:glycerophosphoryl diester phosphodiesterase